MSPLNDSRPLRRSVATLSKRARRVRNGLRWRWQVRSEFREDRARYLRLCAPPDSLIDRNSPQRHIECQVTKDYHRVEKGLALRFPKRPFGAAVEGRLTRLLPSSRAGGDAVFVDYGHDALAALQEWNETGVINAEISPVSPSRTSEPSSPSGEFFLSRRSVRQFDDVPVDRALLRAAAAAALGTPSVCNRQAWRAHFFDSPSDVAAILALQNGNGGFRSEVPAVAVVTVDARLFSSAGERNQRWVDGGLFAMTLVWTLHAQGLATCMLNWSVGNEQSAKLRGSAGLDEAEDIIVLIAIGFPAPALRVARSPKRSLDEVARFAD